MKAVSCLKDARISAHNVLFEIRISDYERLISNVLKNNIFQRRRVRSSKTVYSLLKDDLKKQCVIPPIVLALNSKSDEFDDANLTDFERLVEINKDSLVILDGLQRTYTMLDLLQELRSSGDESALREVADSKIRMEVYVGINRLGILYRMLTLNTGQTPMSLRQQIEILYLDYLETSLDGIELVRESEGRMASALNQYNFRDIVEGFNSYLDRDELPIDKSDLLENISSLEKLSKENQSTELFEKYVTAFSAFMMRGISECDGSHLSEEYLEINASPFGKTFAQVFKKSQAMSGFGAAVGKLVDFNLVSGFQDIVDAVGEIEIDDPEGFLEDINNSLDWLKNNTKKIGNAQRSFFGFFFRDLFNPEGDTHLDLALSSRSALRKYQGQNM